LTKGRIAAAHGRYFLYLTIGRPFPKNCPFPWKDLYMVPWAYPSLQPKVISIGSAVFAGLTIVTYRPTDRQTDHATRSVTIGRIYVSSMRCGLMMAEKNSVLKNHEIANRDQPQNSSSHTMQHSDHGPAFSNPVFSASPVRHQSVASLPSRGLQASIADC